jgi:type I restriction enzyme, S subunit
MSNKERTALAPKLRFPGFQGDSGWPLKKIGDYLTESRLPGSKGDVAKKITVKLRGNGVFEKNEATQGSVNTQYFQRKSGQFIYSKLDFLNQAFGIIPSHLDRYESTVDLPCFDFSGELTPAFLLEYVSRKEFFERVGEAADGSRKAKRIHAETFLSFRVALPSSAEQQKVADCLSSLDELISAQARKVDALKTHKEGLMQQLFPCYGEKQPRLRFAEFLDAENWEETRLGKMGELVSGLTYSPDDVRDSGLLVLRSSNVQDGKISLADCVYVDPNIKGANWSVSDDILICVRNGSAALIGKSALIPEGMPLCTHGAFMTIFRAKSPKFAFQLLQTETYQKQVAGDLGATINSINGSQLVKYTFMVPKPEEQQKIAELLESIDDLIADQAQELDALKNHKKGLMQQLFPSVEALEA